MMLPISRRSQCCFCVRENFCVQEKGVRYVDEAGLLCCVCSRHESQGCLKSVWSAFAGFVRGTNLIWI